MAFPLVGLLSDRFGLGRSMMVLPVVAMLGGVVSLLAVRTFSRDCHFPADFGSATIMSSSTRAPGEESWLMHTVVEAGSQSPK